MTNDPFKNFKSLNPKPASKPASKTSASNNFVESIRDMGGSIVKSLKNDVVKGTAQSIFDQLLGSAKTGQAPNIDSDTTPNLEALIAEREAAAFEAGKQEATPHKNPLKESQVIFSFADEKVKKEVDGVRQELAMLVATMGKVEKQIEVAMMDNIVDGGLYHLNYFQKLKTWIKFMRKSLEDSSSWLQMSGGRKSKGYYWAQEARSGTKYSMSSERNVQMGAG